MNENISQPLFQPSQDSLEDTIDLLELWNTLWSYKKWVILIFFLGSVGSILFALSKTSQYVSTATFLPVSAKSGSNFGNLGGLAALAGVSLPSGGSGGIDFEIVLTSRFFTETIVRELDLLPVFFEKTVFPQTGEVAPPPDPGWFKILFSKLKGGNIPNKPIDPALKEQLLYAKASSILKGMVSVSQKNGLYSIEVIWKEPQLAALIANKYIAALEDYLAKTQLTTTKKSRTFIESQLQKTERNLTEAETALKNFSEQYGIYRVEDQASSVTQAVGRVKGEIAVEEVNLEVAQKLQAPNSPQIELIKVRLEALRNRLRKLEKGEQQAKVLGETYSDIPLSELPELGLRYNRLVRELGIQQEIYKMLRTQLETTKIEESKESDSIQVIDRALPAEFPSKPNKQLIVVLGGVTSLFFGIFLVFFVEFVKNMKKENQRRKLNPREDFSKPRMDT
ncbi:MAG: GumC family protein [SAR324 cluster bacterium]|nr:GumC family protein [SAR324 cluster bacterium]